MKLSDAQIKWLRWFHDLGGDGYMDRYGRLVVAGELSAQGAQLAWLNLVSKGLIAGGGDRLFLTAAGKKFFGEGVRA